MLHIINECRGFLKIYRSEIYKNCGRDVRIVPVLVTERCPDHGLAPKKTTAPDTFVKGAWNLNRIRVASLKMFEFRAPLAAQQFIDRKTHGWLAAEYRTHSFFIEMIEHDGIGSRWQREEFGFFN